MKEFLKDFNKFSKVFKRISFIILVLITLAMPIASIIGKASFEHSQALIGLFGADSKEAKGYSVISPLELIYKIEYGLGIISLICFLIYWGFRLFKFKNVKVTWKSVYRVLPLIILGIFMAWAIVGCIQLSMEVDAEKIVKTTKNIADVPERIREIANWGSTNRHSNAKLYTWRGYDTARDGYISFLVYATVLFNVLMLGMDSRNLKEWIMRSLLLASFFIGLCTFLAFFFRWTFYGTYYWNRAIFLNSNHYGYYLSIVVMLTVSMFIMEKNRFFRVFAFLNMLLHFPVLIINNTFGAYLGILAGIVFAGIVILIRVIGDHSKEKVFELVRYVCAIIVLVICSNCIHYAFCTNYTSKGTKYTYARMILNLGDKSYFYTFNSLNEEEAKSAGISKNKVDGTQVKWGVQKEEIEKKTNTIVSRNFRKLFNDIGIWNKFYSGAELDSGEVANKKSGLGETISKTGSGRGDVWIKSLDLINQRPVFGWGLESTGNEYTKQYGLNEGRAHNLVLQMGATCGVPGVIMYLFAVTLIFLKNIFDVKYRKYDKKGIMFIIALYIIITFLANIIATKITDKLLIIGFVNVFLWTLLFAVVFIKKLKLRVKIWDNCAFTSCCVFVSYMVSSIFGNSSLVTSPLFIIFVGMLTADMIHKTSLIDEEKSELTKV